MSRGLCACGCGKSLSGFRKNTKFWKNWSTGEDHKKDYYNNLHKIAYRIGSGKIDIPPPRPKPDLDAKFERFMRDNVNIHWTMWIIVSEFIFAFGHYPTFRGIIEILRAGGTKINNNLQRPLKAAFLDKYPEYRGIIK